MSQRLTDGAIWERIDGERVRTADLLDGLTPAQLNVRSLCAEWTVQDVAAHLTVAPRLGGITLIAEMARARGSFNRMIRDTALRSGARPAAEISADLRGLAGHRRLAPGISPMVALLDILVHTQDIVVPLGIRHGMPLDAAAAGVGVVSSMGFPYQARRRLGGYHLIAEDADSEARFGPVPVRGPVDAVLLVLTGRPAGVDRLSGPPDALAAIRAACG